MLFNSRKKQHNNAFVSGYAFPNRDLVGVTATISTGILINCKTYSILKCAGTASSDSVAVYGLGADGSVTRIGSVSGTTLATKNISSYDFIILNNSSGNSIKAQLSKS